MTAPRGAQAAPEVAFLDAGNVGDVNDVADLHEEFLGDSLVVKFGDAFLRKFYYGTLVRDGLIRSTICRADGRVVGFFSYTMDQDFMGRGLRRHPVRVLWLILVSVVRQPSLIKDVILVLRLLIGGGSETREAMAGCQSEGLSLAVRPEWTKAVPTGGESRVTVRLFEELVADLRREHVRTLCMYVQPLNMASNLFFSSLGCDLKQVKRAGLACNRYTYHLQENGPDRVGT